jgi:hypothetical protein
MQIWSNFSDTGESLPIRYGRDVLDNVAWANLYLLEPGDLVRVKGEMREVKAVGTDHIAVGAVTGGGRVVSLKRAGSIWHVSIEVSRAVRALTKAYPVIEEDVEPSLRPWLSRWTERFAGLDPMLDLPVESGDRSEALSFLGGLGNRLLAEIVQRAGTSATASEWGVALEKPRMLNELSDVPSLVAATAPGLADHVPVSVHFGMLPDALKAREISSVVADPRVIESIERIPSMRQRVVPPAPIPPWHIVSP